ncbi:hypothetical protein CC1G_05638 [Coprinopsis cinerea okayama7|uniref:Uncharacterized protein n=1 Tax=Coprinopsis cinerea (strain Okayama-7 / 130 / ATCC MYA-4618 / FGSC 9003) TaxID=240176 RepID=A8P1R2_COPC7|nr:hypothetical protein CC1G_05638 [Coprinopsis cinerea okayama7\|eukprot:XP_001838157.1 hypothetical protein CC1G_05638 [Coprinopsis cinerea okayama7\
MKVLSIAAAAFAFLAVAGASPVNLEARQTCVKLTQKEAEDRLKANGITASSSGNCTDRKKSNCTSYEGICSHTVNGVIALKKGVGRNLVITGGTETGHASGTYSHANGYKVDLRLIPEIEAYVKKNFEKGSNRNGDPRWYSPSGNEFVKESNHWDVTFYP